MFDGEPFDSDHPGKAENVFSQYCTPHTNTFDPMRAMGAEVGVCRSVSFSLVVIVQDDLVTKHMTPCKS